MISYEFEIHFDSQEFETIVGAEDIVEAIGKVIDIYKSSFNINLTEDNFIIIGEQYG